MKQQGGWPGVLGYLVLAVSLMAGSGCQLLMTHEVEKPADLQVAVHDLLPACRDHVYIYILHGTDPLDFANINGLNNYLRELGFRKTYYGQLYHRNDAIREMRQVHECDSEARFVVIGFSLGANAARDVVNSVEADGVQVDLLVYLGGNTLEDVPRDRPANAGKIVNILARGCIWNGTTFADAENIHLPDVFHFGSPMHPYTRQMLARELTMVASRVTVITRAGQLPSGPHFDEPTPRPLPPAERAARDEWDFLQPAGGLQAPETTSRPAGPTTARLAGATGSPTLAHR